MWQIAAGIALFSTGTAWAQSYAQSPELQPPAEITPTQLAPIPPPIVAPPPQQYAPPPPALDYNDDLSRRGHKNKVAGAWLMGVGSAFTLLGETLVIHAMATRFPRCSDGCAGDYAYNLGELITGVISALAGSAMLYSGIPIYVVGGAQVRKAEHRRNYSFAPTLSAQGAGATVRCEF